jgi:hypothetical protein
VNPRGSGVTAPSGIARMQVLAVEHAPKDPLISPSHAQGAPCGPRQPDGRSRVRCGTLSHVATVYIASHVATWRRFSQPRCLKGFTPAPSRFEFAPSDVVEPLAELSEAMDYAVRSSP